MKLAIYSILTVIAMTGSTFANQCEKGTETDESQASSSKSTEDTAEEKKDLLKDKES